MQQYKKTALPKNTYQFDVVIPKEEIQKTSNEALLQLAQQLEVPGFRKGKAPFEIARKEIKKEAIYEQTMQKLISHVYQEVTKAENITPIIPPKIELVEAKENEDWKVKITVAEKPSLNLRDYKQLIRKAKSEQKKETIWVPGQSPDAKPQEENKEEKQKKLFQIIFGTLLKNIPVAISDMLIESERNKRLTQLVDDVRKIGLTMDAYLASKHETIESLKTKYTKEIEEMYALEFILEEIAETEKIVVENKDLEKLFSTIKEEKAKEEARKNAYFYATLVRRQKTLDYLMGL